ncbi:MAG: bifunctional oligoribonuclease/PAP phosphatase NrnA [Frankiaceae bacterium]|nr:bifunctional oligoribonuclease/PAP phosphatase NrnA [Frankiaceae bacterium]
MSPDPLDTVAGLLAGADSVALACHVGPDGDALGSMLGLGAALRGLGKDVVASWGGDPFEVPAAYSFLPALDLLVPPTDFPAAPPLLVTLDTGSPDRLGSLADRLASAACVVVVDHHASNTLYGTVNLVDATAAATVVLVEQLLERLGAQLTPDVAVALYTGLVTDTGSFKYSATTPAVHELAARLLATGIRHDLISRAIYDTAPFAYLGLLGGVAARAALEPAAVGGLGLVWSTVPAEAFAESGLGLADVEGVIDVVRTAREAEVAVVLKADPLEGGWKVSTRSKGAVDVGLVCTALGGGGHRFAAGYSSSRTADDVLAELRAALASAPHLPS